MNILNRITSAFSPIRKVTDFEELVYSSFLPLASRHKLRLRKLREGIFQIDGIGFHLRIRKGTGHRADFLVTVLPAKYESVALEKLEGEIGLGVIVEFNGAAGINTEKLNSEAFMKAAENSEKYCLPYLLGTKSDFDGILTFVEKKIEKHRNQSRRDDRK